MGIRHASWNPRHDDGAGDVETDYGLPTLENELVLFNTLVGFKMKF
jgi:hypothetical protein